MKTISTISLILLFPFAFNYELHAQNDSLNHLKYEIYRDRLFQKFIAYDATTDVLHTPGTFIPASKRIELESSKKLWWGEGTIYLSCLMQVLASEYWLRKMNGEDVSQTLEDLYHALLAFRRLDMYAESSFRSTPETYDEDLNGFFIRDDIPYEIINQYPYLINHGDPSKWYMASDFHIDCCSWKDKYHKEMSQDQVWHMLLGMAMINHFVDTVLSYPEFNFPFWAQYHSKQMVNFIKGKKNFKWQLRNPVDGHKTPQRRGGKARIMGYGFGEASSEITGSFQHKYNSENGFWRTTYFSGWVFLYTFDDDFCFRILSTIADLPDYDDHSKLCSLYERRKVYRYPQFPLIFPLLHEDDIEQEHSDVEHILSEVNNMLNEAPIEGPCSTCGMWSATNLLIWTETSGIGPPGEEYNGLDYMLLHNLYYLFKIKISDPVL